MDLNQLYYDHQILLMRAAKAPNGTDKAAHRANAATIARTITGMHRASGARAMQSWECRYISVDQQSTRPAIRSLLPVQ
jgi:hypothetical protein